MMTDEHKHPSIEDLSFEDLTFGDSSNSLDLLNSHRLNITGHPSSTFQPPPGSGPGPTSSFHHHHLHPDHSKKSSLLTASLQQHQQQQSLLNNNIIVSPPTSTSLGGFNHHLISGSTPNTPNNGILYNSNLSLLSAAVAGSMMSPSSSSLKPPKDKRTKSDKSDRHAVLVSSKGDKINVGLLLKQLEECGPVRAHHFRERQTFGFVQFLDSDSADNAIDKLNNQEIDGQIITIERIKRITPGKDPRVATVGSPQCSSLPTQLPSMIENKPDSTLVLKNLPFNLRQVQLQEILENINPSAPQSVNFHYDSIGVFRGMAFVKYRLVEDAIKVFDALNGTDVYGRRVRLEYKRKVSKSSEIPPEVLEDEKLRKVWDQLKEYKDDQLATGDLTFSNFSGVQRMYIHNMAEKLKLTHTSVGEEPNRSIIVTNKKPTSTVGTPSKDETGSSYLLSSSPIGLSSALSVGGTTIPSQMSVTPSNSYSSTPSMFIHAPPPSQSSSMNINVGSNNNSYKQSNTLESNLSGSFGNHFLRSTPPLSTSFPSISSNNSSNTNKGIPILTANNSDKITTPSMMGTSWEKSPTNSSIVNNTHTIFTSTRGFGPIVSRDRSFSTPDIDAYNQQQQQQQPPQISTSPVNNNLWRGTSSSLKENNNSFNNNNSSFNSNHPPSLHVGFNHQQQPITNNSFLSPSPNQNFNSSNNINIQSSPQQINNNNNSQNNIVSSPILSNIRQPKGPDGTKGFSNDYRIRRTVVQS